MTGRKFYQAKCHEIGLDLSVVIDFVRCSYGLVGSNQMANPLSSRGLAMSGKTEVDHANA